MTSRSRLCLGSGLAGASASCCADNVSRQPDRRPRNRLIAPLAGKRWARVLSLALLPNSILAGEFAIARLVAKMSLSGRGGPVDLLVARHIRSAVNRKVGANVLLLEFVDVRVE